MMTPRLKNFIAFAIDGISAFLVSLLSLYIRLDEVFFLIPTSHLLYQGFIFSFIAIAINYHLRIHKGIWRYFNLDYLKQIVKSAFLITLVFTAVLFLDSRLDNLPRSVIILNWILLTIFMIAPRALYRVLRTKQIPSIKTVFDRINSAPTSPILIAGVGSAAEIFITELNNLPHNNYTVVGIIDVKENVGRYFLNIPVLGTINELTRIVNKLDKKKKRPIRLLISSDLYLGDKLQKLTAESEKLSLPISKLPKLTELQHGSTASPIKSLPIEDLLRRRQKIINYPVIHKHLDGKRVLITGAGGSIGSEVVRQVLKCNPLAVCLLDISEFLLYEIQQEALNIAPKTHIEIALCDISNLENLTKSFNRFKPDTIIHAAALKHVPMLEDHKMAAISTNIIGTYNLISLANKYKIKDFVFISTDKAVHPSSFMGMTKRFAELICQTFAKDMAMTIVRFGNVLGSNGSVIPLFEKQIGFGGPITVTHEDATRYFMTIKEAVGLLLESSTMSERKSSKIYVLDMGEPIKIIDLAHHMITLAGYKPNKDIAIKVIGLRPGEKLHETLFYENENLGKTSNQEIFLSAVNKIDGKFIQKSFEQLIANNKLDSEADAVKIVLQLVKKFA